jgi:hypothetical protein
MPRSRYWRRAKSTTTRGPLNRNIAVLRSGFAGIADRTKYVGAGWACCSGSETKGGISDHAL